MAKKVDRIGGWTMFDIVKLSPALKARTAARELALHIARFSDPDGTGSFPSLKALAECMGYRMGLDGEPTKVTMRKVRAALAALDGDDDSWIVRLEPSCNCGEDKRRRNPHPEYLEHFRLNLRRLRAAETDVVAAPDAVPDRVTSAPDQVPDRVTIAPEAEPDRVRQRYPIGYPVNTKINTEDPETRLRPETLSGGCALTASSRSTVALLPPLDGSPRNDAMPAFTDNTTFGERIRDDD